jgi:sarcosine oxidase
MIFPVAELRLAVSGAESVMAHIVVVGAGIVGIGVARAAVKCGHAVTIFEQGSSPNPQAASYDQHRMIRYHYGSAEGYTRMVGSAFPAWDRVWDDLGETHFENSGAISISLGPGDYADRTLAVFRAIGLPHEILDRDAVERLCPHLRLPEGSWGLVAFPGGPPFASRIVDELTRWVIDRGAVIRSGCRVVGVDEDNGSVTLADGSTFAGDLVLVATGAWLPELMPERYGDIPVQRQALCYVEPPPRFKESWRTAPAIASIGDGGTYTLPDLRGAGLKFGSGAHRRRASPRDGFQSDLAAESSAVIGAFAPYLSEPQSYRAIRMQVGFYVMDEHRRFRLDHYGRTLVVTNCDGQMFKFGPLLGERIVASFEGKESAADLARWAAGY